MPETNATNGVGVDVVSGLASLRRALRDSGGLRVVVSAEPVLVEQV